MMLLRRILTILALLATLSGAIARDAAACSCVERSLDQRIAEADRIVLARVLSATYHPQEEPFLEIRTNYQVLEVLKGAASPDSGVVTEPIWGPGSCSMPLLPGHQYVLFLSDPPLVTICSGAFIFVPGNRPSEESLKELRDRLNARK